MLIGQRQDNSYVRVETVTDKWIIFDLLLCYLSRIPLTKKINK